MPGDGGGGEEGGIACYRTLVALLAVTFVGLGVALIVVTALRGVGVGILLGLLFVGLGLGRLYLLRRR